MEEPKTPDEIAMHNLREAVRMVQSGMSPVLVSTIFEKEGIAMPEELIYAASQPGVLESMSAKASTKPST